MSTVASSQEAFCMILRKGTSALGCTFFFSWVVFFFLCWNDCLHPLGGITPSLRFQVACICGCHQSLSSQSGEWPMVSYQFYQFWTSSKVWWAVSGKWTRPLVYFRNQIFSALTEATESLRVLNWTAALSQTHLAFQLRICTPITSSY